MKTRYLLQICAGTLVAAAGIALTIASTDTVLSSALVAFGTVMVTLGIFRHRRFGDRIESDEMTESIGTKAAARSWFVTLLFLCALFWVDELSLIPLDIRGAILATVLVMTLSVTIFSWHLARAAET
ncbi:MAG: hypothetical protein PHP59_08545 [Methanofollis sp.]|uniref:hypothetical protein n=1 Tax=Methanofollis sp. TaxID=2052835 RepID=UPI002609844B|nr:hypothetical protein [Methanofollis sp.]MDD4255408.1 hypothetical protein [Methanofollis sp.]